MDYRDQHLMASVNSLSAEEWYASYGKVYKTLIDYGAPTLMSAHILQPALAPGGEPRHRGRRHPARLPLPRAQPGHFAGQIRL